MTHLHGRTCVIAFPSIITHTCMYTILYLCILVHHPSSQVLASLCPLVPYNFVCLSLVYMHMYVHGFMCIACLGCLPFFLSYYYIGYIHCSVLYTCIPMYMFVFGSLVTLPFFILSLNSPVIGSRWVLCYVHVHVYTCVYGYNVTVHVHVYTYMYIHVHGYTCTCTHVNSCV